MRHKSEKTFFGDKNCFGNDSGWSTKVIADYQGVGAENQDALHGDQVKLKALLPSTVPKLPKAWLSP